ncbi:MAG: PAS domain S-box protein [Ferruginibacter sp.]
MLNKLLAQQVQRHLGDIAGLPEAFTTFIKSISGSYDGFDEKINSLETALDEGAGELRGLNEKLLNETTELKNANNELSRIFNQVNEGFFVKDIIGDRYIQMSVGCEKIYGYSIGDFYANSLLWFQVIHPDDRVLIDEENELLNNGVKTKSAYRIILKDKTTRWIEVKAIPVIVQGRLTRVEGVVNDITERKNAEKLLIEREAKYRSFFENNIDGVLLSRPDGAIEEANPAACEIFKATEKEICEYSRSGLLRIADPSLLSLLEERDHTGKVKGEGIFMRRDGTTFSAEIASSKFKDTNGEERTSTIVRDITDRKKAEAAMVMNERQLDLIYNTVTDSIFMLNIEAGDRYKFVSVNLSFLKATGLKKEQVIGKYIAELIPSPSLELALAKYKEALTEKKTISWEEQTRYPTGIKTGIVSINPVLEDNGNCIRIIGSVHDISEERKAEQSIAESEQRYRQIVETAQEGIWMIDEDNNTTFINKKMCEIIEYAPEEIMGKRIHIFMDGDANKNAAQQIERRKQGISETHDSTFITKSGKAVSTSVSTNPVFDEAGIYKGALAMVTDITKRKHNEELLQKSEANLDQKNKELERKNKELEQFAYVASHDLQEPLRTTCSFVQLLKEQYEGKLDKKADKYLHFIVDSSDRMKILINDLLEYSRIGSTHKMERVNCNKILQDVIADLYKAISDSAAEIISEELPIVNGYPTEIKQLFQNLVINAIKFSKLNVIPLIKISVKRSGGYWHFTIADNGIGIEQQHSERIFIIFQRLHTRSEYPGSGIGLSHCKKIVELHHGKIWVDSIPGEGSVFHFTIPENESM